MSLSEAAGPMGLHGRSNADDQPDRTTWAGRGPTVELVAIRGSPSNASGDLVRASRLYVSLEVIRALCSDRSARADELFEILDEYERSGRSWTHDRPAVPRARRRS